MAPDFAEQVRQILRSNGIEPKSAEIGVLFASTGLRLPNCKTQTRRVPGKCQRFSKAEKTSPKFRPSSNNWLTLRSVKTRLSITRWRIWMRQGQGCRGRYRRARESATALARSQRRTLGELFLRLVDTFENVRVAPMAGAMMKMM